MAFTFQTLSSGLRSGFTVLGDVLTAPVRIPLQLGSATAGLLLPAPPRVRLDATLAAPSPVSVAFGPRPVSTQAATVTNPFFAAWQRANEAVARGVDRLRFGAASQTVRRQPVVRTLFDQVNRVGQVAINTVADRFVDRLIPRQSSGDLLGQRPGPVQSEIHLNDTRSPAPATIPFLGDVFSFLRNGTQPGGAFHVGFPQGGPIPVSSGFVGAPASGGPNLLVLGVVGLVVFILLKRARVF